MKPEMELPRPPRLSLRARFALGLAAVLLPFLLAAGVGQFYLLPRLLGPLEAIVYEIAEEMRPVATLELALLNTHHASHNYLIRGDPAVRVAFERSNRRVEEAFEAASLDRFHAEEERAILRAARAEWEQARRLADALLRLPDPAANAAARDMERFEAHVDRAAGLLGQMQESFSREIGEERVRAQAAKRQATLLTAAVLAAALGIVLTAGTLLGRYVLGSVDALRRAARRLEEGDLAARVALEGNDELGELALAFNAMAEKIERHERSLEERSLRLSALNQIAVAITSSLSLQNILDEIMRRGIALTGAKAACIAFYDEAARRFTNWVTQGLTEHFVGNIAFRPDGLADEAFTSGFHILSNDRPETEYKLSRLIREEGLRCFICLPLTSHDRRLGVIYVYRADRDTFTPVEFELLATFASLAAQAIENARLYDQVQDQARTDALTGLYNRREFDRRLKEELERSRRYTHLFSLLMLDIDHFKVVNDTYGHPAGDEVLRALAARIRGQVRPVDQVARYGGEEFTVILPETGGAGALAFAERLCAAIAAVPFALDAGRSIHLTASIGVASFPQDGETERDLIAAADHALYGAKQSGRNRVRRRSDG